jgi:hypothetical protein
MLLFHYDTIEGSLVQAARSFPIPPEQAQPFLVLIAEQSVAHLAQRALVPVFRNLAYITDINHLPSVMTLQ